MMRSAILLSALASSADAKKFSAINPKGSTITADSKLGNNLLSKARRLDGEDNRDYTWVTGFSIQFKSCHTMTAVPSGEGGGGEEGAGLYNSNVVVFQLCPSDTCGDGKCKNGAEYAVSMAQFVDAYTEARLTEEEYTCEMIRENCYCNDDNDDEACQNQCYTDEGVDYCIEYDGDDDFEVQEYLECNEMENYENYFIGPYCSADGSSIHLGIFADAGCVNVADDGLYLFKKYTYTDLPFSSSDESLVSDKCTSCKEPEEDNDDNNNNNNNNDEEMIEMCEELYQQSAKCESSLGNPSYSNYWYPNDEACNYITNTLPALDRVFQTGKTGSPVATTFAWLFGITTVSLMGLVYWLHTKVERSTVSLSDQGGVQA